MPRRVVGTQKWAPVPSHSVSAPKKPAAAPEPAKPPVTQRGREGNDSPAEDAVARPPAVSQDPRSPDFWLAKLKK